jgi:hypothetical protein
MKRTASAARIAHIRLVFRFAVFDLRFFSGADNDAFVKAF